MSEKTTIRIGKKQQMELMAIKFTHNCDSLEEALDILLRRIKKNEKSAFSL